MIFLIASMLNLAWAQAESALPTTLPPRVEAPAPQSTLELEWEVVEEAESYEIKLTPKKGGPPLHFTSKEPSLSRSVPSGVYILQIRSKESSTGYMGAWSDPSDIEVASKNVELLRPKDHEIIPEPRERRRIVTFEWAPIAGAKLYSLRVWDEDPKKAKDFSTRKTTKQLDLPAGRTYHWQVTVEDERSIKYQTAGKTNSFSLLGKQLIKPIVQPRLPGFQLARWSNSPGADRYESKVFYRPLDESTWQVLHDKPDVKETKWKFKKLKPGSYKVQVIAHAKNRVSSEPGEHEFIVKPSETELATLMKNLDPVKGR